MVDPYTNKRYPYTLTDVLSQYDSDDLLRVYFHGQQIVGVAYVVQC